MKPSEIIEYIPDAFKIAIGDEVYFNPNCQWTKPRTGIVSAIINTERGQGVVLVLNNVRNNGTKNHITTRMPLNRVWPTTATVQNMWKRTTDTMMLYTHGEAPDGADAAIPIRLTKRNWFIFTAPDLLMYVIADYAKSKDGQIYKIVRIDDDTFRAYDFNWGCGMYIPDTITEIGAYAFAETKLYDMFGGHGLRKIEHNAFTHTEIDMFDMAQKYRGPLTRDVMKNNVRIDIDKIEIGENAFDE